MNDDLNIFNLVYGYVNIGKEQIQCGGFATQIPQMSRVWVNFLVTMISFLFKVIDYQDGGCIYPTSKLKCKH
jgi:hypothetical protein